MSIISSSRDLNILNKDEYRSSLFNKKNSMNCVYYRSDVVNKEKNIPNIFITPAINQSDGILHPSILERENGIPNIFSFTNFQTDSTSNYDDKFCKYPNLFTLHDSYSEPCGFKGYFWETYSNYTNVFSLSDMHHINYVQHVEVNNSNDVKQEKNNTILNDKLSHESLFKKDFSDNYKVNELHTTERCTVVEKNPEENMSFALCFWCIVRGINVRDHNIKTYFPQREISSICIMKDVKLMLINMGSTYFFVDEETHMYKRNGNISIIGLTPEMFESATDPILECSNLYKMLSSTIIKWKKTCDDSIAKAFIFAISNILDDYERTIYAESHESLLSLVGRLSHLTPRLHLLANICCLKTHNGIVIPDQMPSGIYLLNQVYDYLFDYRFPHDVFLRMLLYIFESCSLAYFRILSNWALKGVLDDKELNMFVILKPDFEDDICSRKNWNRFNIDESIEIPIFFDKYKKDIFNCGKTINFFNKFNDLNVFLPDFICCFDAADTQKAYEKFSIYFKYDSSFRTINCVKTMTNCYLFESIIRPDHPKENIDSNVVENKNITNVTSTIKMYSENENYEFFQMYDWTSVNNIYDFNKPHGFFIDHNDSLTYNGKPIDVNNVIDYVPHSILIPARIQKNICDKQILDLFFIQEHLMGRLYYLSQCFFLMNSQFSSKLCEMLFDGIAINRQNPLNIFNPVMLTSIVDESVQYGFSEMRNNHNLILEIAFIPRLNGIIDISDVECIELNYSPKWPMDMILSNKILLKYRRIFMFANKLKYISWSLLKARELLSVYKNDNGLQFRKINLFKHWMNQFVSSIEQYYKQVVIGTCWSELNDNFKNVQNYDDLFEIHKQYMHTMLRRCFMVVGLKDKLILLNKIYIEILAYYQALASGQFYMNNSERLHSEYFSMEQSFSRFAKLREMFYTSILKTVQTGGKHYVVQLESLITILGPSYNFT